MPGHHARLSGRTRRHPRVVAAGRVPLRARPTVVVGADPERATACVEASAAYPSGGPEFWIHLPLATSRGCRLVLCPRGEPAQTAPVRVDDIDRLLIGRSRTAS